MSCKPGSFIINQGTFVHDKGQKSAISGAIGGSPLDFLLFLQYFYVQFSKTSPLKFGESSEKFSGENRVKSCHVRGCHGFFGPLLLSLHAFSVEILQKEASLKLSFWPCLSRPDFSRISGIWGNSRELGRDPLVSGIYTPARKYHIHILVLSEKSSRS